ncbi:alpha/beta fold hydrolase [Oleomonas cavernae]|uniref:alpha/beta fold hydrolase n=1 Tax=Oleomonas cavernae TaxID=2320859 RepID=UPI0018F6721B|nr:alpha/beta fold hydrolase [Oleomonas cavernae]
MAQEFAFNHARLCRRLVLAATSPGVLMVPGSLSTMLKLVTPRRYYDRDYLRRNAAKIYGGAFGRDLGLVDQHFQGMTGTGGLGYALQLLAMSGWTSLPWLPLIRQPTLVLMGSDDQLVRPINGRILASLIPRAHLEMIEDGHMFIVSRPQETAAVIEAFLSRP